MSPSPDLSGHYIFLSYASVDRERALQIADLLEANGISVWIDRKSIEGGTSWSAEIVRGIRECAALVVACSVAAMASPNVQQEIQLAWEARRPILPLLFEPVKLPDAIQYALVGRQWIEVSDPVGDEWLTRALRALAGFGIVARDRSTASVTMTQPDPPPVTAVNPPTTQIAHLPAQRTAFIGRAGEVEAVRRLVLQPGVRLVTLTGPGGVGKSRLAIEVASGLLGSFPDGVYFVPLDAVTDSAAVGPAIAQKLDVRESATQTMLESVCWLLRAKQCLLVLDNFEQVVDAAPVVSQVLAECPAVKALVTSRTPLRAYGEQEFTVDPLPLPDLTPSVGLDQVARNEAIQLFVERARAVRPDFALRQENADTIAQICRRLDGLPLAIELAAARIRIFGPEAMLARLAGRLPLLTGGGRDLPARQRTLRATLDWSYELLTPQEQVLFARLAVFVGGSTLKAVEEVCRQGSVRGDLGEAVVERLESLLAQSLVQAAASSDGETRFAMLVTVREYAGQKLEEGGEVEEVRHAHARYFVALAERAEPELLGPDARVWLDRLEHDHDNLRAVLAWVEDHDPAAGLRLAGALAWFWFVRGYWSEGRDRAARALNASDKAGVSTPGSDNAGRALSRVSALLTAGQLALSLGDRERGGTWLRQAVDLGQTLGSPGKRLASWALGWRAWASDADQQTFGEGALALAREADDRLAESNALMWLGLAAGRRRDDTLARQLLETSLEICRQAGTEVGVAAVMGNLGILLVDWGEAASARAYLEEALALQRDLGAKQNLTVCLGCLGDIAFFEGKLDEARACYEESLAISQDLGYQYFTAYMIVTLGHTVLAAGNKGAAARHYDEGMELLTAIDDPGVLAWVKHLMGQLAVDQEDLTRARSCFADSLTAAQGLDQDHPSRLYSIALGLADAALVAAVEDRGEEAVQLLAAAEKALADRNIVIHLVDRADHERLVARVRRSISSAEWESAYEKGQLVAFEQASERAFGVLRE